MIGTLLVAGVLVGAPDTSDALQKIDHWIDTAFYDETMAPWDPARYDGYEWDKDIERRHTNEKGPYSDPYPTWATSPFNRECGAPLDWA